MVESTGVVGWIRSIVSGLRPEPSDANRLHRASRQLDKASRAADQGLRIQHPQHRAERFAAVQWHADKALQELEGVDGPLHDARDAIRWLRSVYDPGVGNPRRELYDAWFSGVHDLRIYAKRLRSQASTLHMEAEAAQSAYQRQVAEIEDKARRGATTSDILHLAALETLPDEIRPDLEPGMFRSMVSWNSPEYYRVQESFQALRERALVRAVVADPSTSRASLDVELRGIIARGSLGPVYE